MMTDEEYFDRITSLIDSVARHLCSKQNVAHGAAYGFDDLTGDLMLKALEKREKLEPRLEAGEDAYVFSALRNDGRDALKNERAHKKAGTLEDVERYLYSTDRPPTLARKNSNPAQAKILGTAAKAGDRAAQRAHLQGLKVVLLSALEGEDREIFRLHALDYNAHAIALTLGMGVSTVYRRLSDIKGRLAQMLAEVDA